MSVLVSLQNVNYWCSPYPTIVLCPLAVIVLGPGSEESPVGVRKVLLPKEPRVFIVVAFSNRL